MNAFFSVDPAQRKYCTFSFPDEENGLQTILPKNFLPSSPTSPILANIAQISLLKSKSKN